jgi:iron complex outermembrane receptor protein
LPAEKKQEDQEKNRMSQPSRLRNDRPRNQCRVLVFGLPLLSAFTAGAAENTRFDIPPQPLNSALLAFGKQSGRQLLYGSEMTEGLKTGGLKGEYPPEIALDRLLAGTPLTYSVTPGGTVTLARAEKPAPAVDRQEVQLSPIMVKGEAVTEEDRQSYTVTRTSTATKTDTPIMDTPVSVQAVPRAVMDDQKTPDLKEALENVSSVRPQPSLGVFNGFIIRGFQDFNQYRNGLRVGFTSFDTANLQSLEVLKGPAGVLYGRIQPGGLINLTTKKPLDQAYYSLEQQFGNFDFYRTLWDATGPVTQDGALLYRFTGAYQDSDSFREFHTMNRIQVNPSLTWRISDATEISIEVEGFNEDREIDYGIPVIGKRPAPIPIRRALDDPDDPVDNISNVYVGFNLTHRFNEDWTLRNRFLARYYHADNLDITPSPQFDASALRSDNRTLDRNLFHQRSDQDVYATNLDLTGKLDLWDTEHEVLVGFDYYQNSEKYHARGDYFAGDPALAIDIFNPSYNIDAALFDKDRLAFPLYSRAEEQWFGVYFQDHIVLWEKLHIMGGGRYDWATIGRGYSDTSYSAADDARRNRKDDEFSPRVGILYQPWSWLSIYGNWAESFGSNNNIPGFGNVTPETGEQYEAGVKTEFFDGRMTATLAFYNINKKNILTPDLSTADPTDSDTIGEARSKGMELDISGRITDYVSLIGNYAYTDAEITKDNSDNQGNRMPNVPYNSGSLWLKYDVNGFDASNGFSLGVGVFAAGQRDGDNENTFKMPGYVRLDAAAAYRWTMGPSRVTAQLNLRNLLDKAYYESTDPFVNVAPRLAVVPASPFTVLGSVRVEF